MLLPGNRDRGRQMWGSHNLQEHSPSALTLFTYYSTDIYWRSSVPGKAKSGGSQKDTQPMVCMIVPPLDSHQRVSGCCGIPWGWGYSGGCVHMIEKVKYWWNVMRDLTHQAEVQPGWQRPEAMLIDLLPSEGFKAIKLPVWVAASPVLDIIRRDFWEEGRTLVRLVGRTGITRPWAEPGPWLLTEQRVSISCYMEHSCTEERAMGGCWPLEAAIEIWKAMCPLRSQRSCPVPFCHGCLCLTLRHMVT